MSPSGFEEDAARVWRDEAKKFTKDVYSDTHGNSFAVINPNGSPKVMLAGHIDEIGLMVTYIDDSGYLYFTGIGGWDTQVLPGQRVNIKTGTGLVSGVIGRRPIHLLSVEERKKVVEFSDLWIDIGAKNKEDASTIVSIGDPAVIQYGMESLMNNMLVGRGFDDRIGAYVVLEALRLLSEMGADMAVYAVATAQEEIGTRGAKTSVYGINPDIGIAVDVGFATDTPGALVDKKKVGDIKMGEGPVIVRGANINPVLFEMFTKTAESERIPFQVEACPGVTGTDARDIQATRQGVPTALIGIPNRYMHSPCELIHLHDVDHASKLIAHTVLMSKDTDFRIS